MQLCYRDSGDSQKDMIHNEYWGQAAETPAAFQINMSSEEVSLLDVNKLACVGEYAG